MGFNNGDIVVCVNDKPSSFLTYGKEYTVTKNRISIGDGQYIFIDATNIVSFHSGMFVTLEQYRAMKINKIRNGIQKR